MKCNEAWIRDVSFCKATCGQCAPTTSCTDNQPAGGFTCAQQAAWGKVRGGSGAGAALAAALTPRALPLSVRRVLDQSWGLVCAILRPLQRRCGLRCGWVEWEGSRHLRFNLHFNLLRCHLPAVPAVSVAVAGVDSVEPEATSEPACGEWQGGAAGAAQPPLCPGPQPLRPTPRPPSSAAVDVAPPGLFSCAEQAAWGMCEALNATGFCAVECGRCTPDPASVPCDDIPTPDALACSQVGCLRCYARAGRTRAGPRCAAAGARRRTGSPAPCPARAQAAAQGKCSSPYVQKGGYCRRSCGVCGPPADSEGAAGVQAVACTDVPTPDGVTCMVRLSLLGIGALCSLRLAPPHLC